MNRPWIFFFVYVFQVWALSMSACYSSIVDATGPALMMLANSQIERLGIQWSKVKLPDKLTTHSFWVKQWKVFLRLVTERMTKLNSNLEIALKPCSQKKYLSSGLFWCRYLDWIVKKIFFIIIRLEPKIIIRLIPMLRIKLLKKKLSNSWFSTSLFWGLISIFQY